MKTVAVELGTGTAEDKATKNYPVLEHTHNVHKDEKIRGASLEDDIPGITITVELTGTTRGTALIINLILIVTPKLSTSSKICNVTTPLLYLCVKDVINKVVDTAS